MIVDTISYDWLRKCKQTTSMLLQKLTVYSFGFIFIRFLSNAFKVKVMKLFRLTYAHVLALTCVKVMQKKEWVVGSAWGVKLLLQDDKAEMKWFYY